MTDAPRVPQPPPRRLEGRAIFTHPIQPELRMHDTPDDEAFDLESALGQLMEMQQEIDNTALQVVEQVKRMLDHREELEEDYNPEFAMRYGAWYAATQAAASKAGFASLGAWSDRNLPALTPGLQSFYQFALRADGRMIASWFVIPAESPIRCVVLESFGAKGERFVSAAGVPDTGFPDPPEWQIRMYPAGTSLSALAEAHDALIAGADVRTFAGMDQIIEARGAATEHLVAFRRAQGTRLFEGMLRTTFGERYEEEGTLYLESIANHPEWWRDAISAEDEPQEEWAESAPAETGQDEPAELRLLFMLSRDDESGRVHITTSGLALYDLPELQMYDLAANHCRAARLLMRAVALALRATPDLADVLESQRQSGFALPVPAPTGDSVYVHARFESFGGEPAGAGGLLSMILRRRKAADLLTLGPGAQDAPQDAWLPSVGETLGFAVPPAREVSTLDDVMLEASQRAVESLPEFRQMMAAGLPDGSVAVIKTGLATSNGRKEYVWVRVEACPPGAFEGTLQSEPVDCPGFTRGQNLTIPDADVFDRGIFSQHAGVILEPLTDAVAADYGVDIS